jgi:hypothetical protein
MVNWGIAKVGRQQQLRSQQPSCGAEMHEKIVNMAKTFRGKNKS